jgi:hypothetical protein
MCTYFSATYDPYLSKAEKFDLREKNKDLPVAGSGGP